MKAFPPFPQSVPKDLSRNVLGYFGLAGLFFLVSFVSIYGVHRFFSHGQVRIEPQVFSIPVVLTLGILLILYFLADGMRLYCVIRAMGFRIDFPYIVKLVFINMFVSNVTPLATGGGVIQVYFMKQKGMPIGEATAATSIRTILAALILFTLTPLIIWAEPNLFRMFFHRNVFATIAGISCLYLAVFWIILFRIQTIRRWLFRLLTLLKVLKIISRPRRRSIYRRLSHELDLFSEGFRRYFRCSPGWSALSVLCTAFFLLMLFSFSYVLILAMGYEISLGTVLAFQVVVTFFMYFAPTPGAAGVAEGGYGLLFSQLVHTQDITFLTLSWRFLTIYVGVLIGIGIIYREIFIHGKATKA